MKNLKIKSVECVKCVSCGEVQFSNFFLFIPPDGPYVRQAGDPKETACFCRKCLWKALSKEFGACEDCGQGKKGGTR